MHHISPPFTQGVPDLFRNRLAHTFVESGSRLGSNSGLGSAVDCFLFLGHHQAEWGSNEFDLVILEFLFLEDCRSDAWRLLVQRPPSPDKVHDPCKFRVLPWAAAGMNTNTRWPDWKMVSLACLSCCRFWQLWALSTFFWASFQASDILTAISLV